VFLLGLDGQFVSPEGYPAICQARVWLLSIGFTLGYGAMFSKVWRVHRLTTKAKADTVVNTFRLLFIVDISFNNK
jgi:gamma-aminobutyric acid type B receptor